jgi:hypothetical protein
VRVSFSGASSHTQFKLIDELMKLLIAFGSYVWVNKNKAKEMGVEVEIENRMKGCG